MSRTYRLVDLQMSFLAGRAAVRGLLDGIAIWAGCLGTAIARLSSDGFLAGGTCVAVFQVYERERGIEGVYVGVFHDVFAELS